MTEKNTKLYELAYFLSSSINEDEVLKHLDDLKSILLKYDAQITKEELPKIRDLAYQIKHQTQGYFGYMHFNASPEKIKDINTDIKMSDDVLRHIIIEVTKKQIEQMNMPVHQPKKTETEKTNAESVLKEGATSHVDENKVELGELDEKLDEILNK